MWDPTRVDPLERRPGGDGDHGAPPRGSRTLSAILPNGRTLWLEIEPPLAPASKLDHVAQLAESLTHRRQGILRRQGQRVVRLSQAVFDDVTRLDRAHVARSKAFRRRIAAASLETDKRLTKASAEFQARVRKQLAIEREAVRRLRRRDLWDKALLITTLPLLAAYGQRGRPFGANNLALVLTTLIWLVGDDVVEAMFGTGESPSPYPFRDADIWSYIAPIGNLLAGWWLLDDFQHERFVTGRAGMPAQRFKAHAGEAELQYSFKGRIALSPLIAPALFEDFITYKGVPAVATIGSVTRTPEGEAADARIVDVRAEVEGPALVVTVQAAAKDLRPAPTDPFPDILRALDVAWMVDTQKPAAAVPQ